METLPTTEGRYSTEGEESDEGRLSYVKECPECGGRPYLDSRRAELVCVDCGLVIADTMVIPGTERETDEANRSMLEADDSTILPQLYFSSRDSMGHPVKQELMWVLRRTAQTFNLRSGERGAVTMETRIRRLASQRGLPSSIALRAIYFYRQTKRFNVAKKPGLNDWALALLYAACRDVRWVITVEDMAGSAEYERTISNVWRYFKAIKRGLRLPLAPFSVENFVTYFSGRLNLNHIAQTIITRAVYISRTHKNPNSTPHCVAAGALYKAIHESGSNVSQKDFCRHVNVSEISLRSWVNKLGGIRTSGYVIPQVANDEIEDALPEPLPE